MRFALACWASWLWLTAATTCAAEFKAVPAQPTGPAQLLHWFAQTPGLSAHFVERKTMALLAAPLESEGDLYYAAPGLLARYTRRPEQAVLLLDGKMIRMHDGHAWQTLDYSNKPVVRQFAESFVGLLRGDNEQLGAQYRLEWFAPAQGQVRWKLRLTPKQAPMNKLIAYMELQGEGAVVAEMRLVETGGDETVTTYTNVDTRRTFSPAERGRIFAAAPR